MKFTTRFFAISATIAQVLATPQLTNSAYSVTEGKPFTITWTNADGPVTLLLKDGASNNLNTVSTIGSGLTGTSFTWTPSGLPSNEYAFEIQDSTGTNYSPQFPYAGTGTVVSTTAASSTVAASSTTSQSSSSSHTAVVTSTSTGSSSAPSSSTASNSSTTASSSSNSTTTAASTLSKTTSKSTATGTTSSSTSTNTPVNTNDGKKLGSSLAFVVLTAAALLVCH